jgi:molybdenum cofactor synthesis domain-containing protein
MRAAAITVSTSKARESSSDESGPELAAWIARLGLEVVATEVLPDDREAVASSLRRLADQEDCRLVVTSGGTGFSPTDVTPEATRDVIEREAPGIAEALRLASRDHTEHWMLSRGVAGIRGRTLIVNFPGSPAAIRESTSALDGAIAHALALLADEPTAHH